MSGSVVIDTSVFVAILLREPEATALSGAIRSHATRILAAPTYLECAIVVAKRGTGRADLEAWLTREAIEIVPVDHALAQVSFAGCARSASSGRRLPLDDPRPLRPRCALPGRC